MRDETAARLLILDDLAASLARLKRWDEFARRGSDGRRLAPYDPQWQVRQIEGMLAKGHYDEAIAATKQLAPGAKVVPILPRWRDAIASAVKAVNWKTRRDLLAAAVIAGADPQTITRWRRLEFARFVISSTLSGHTNWVRSVAWSPDDSRLATADGNGAAGVVDVASGRQLAIFSSQGSYEYVVAWSPDGSRLATGSTDKMAKIWKASSGRLLATLSGHGASVKSVVWSPDGLRLATASSDGVAIIWGEE